MLAIRELVEEGLPISSEHDETFKAVPWYLAFVYKAEKLENDLKVIRDLNNVGRDDTISYSDFEEHRRKRKATICPNKNARTPAEDGFYYCLVNGRSYSAPTMSSIMTHQKGKNCPANIKAAYAIYYRLYSPLPGILTVLLLMSTYPPFNILTSAWDTSKPV